MKLINKTFIIYTFVGLPLLICSILLAYYQLKSEILDDEFETIISERKYAKQLIINSADFDFLPISADGLSQIAKTKLSSAPGSYTKDTTLFDKYEQESIDFKLYVNYFQKGNSIYKITIAKNQHIAEEFVEGLLFTIAWILALLVIVIAFVNWFSSKLIWKPFFTTLEKLKNYSLSGHDKISFDQSSIFEFDQLNRTLTDMTNSNYNTYLEQKEFTENASHELQTPLAVIQSNLDMLMQSEHLNQVDMQHIAQIERSILKLRSLNKSLLLLAKIENKQFNLKSKINLKQLIDITLSNFEEIGQLKNLTVNTDISNEIDVNMDKALAEILVNNLIQNAFRHTKENGEINIEFRDQLLTISNTGVPLEFNSSDLFVRFKKSIQSNESIGLGLAIVKSIVDFNEFEVSYYYKDGRHYISINFNLKSTT